MIIIFSMKKRFRKYRFLLNIFLMIILFCGLVFAAHIITTPTGETSYSVNEDVIYLHNISVNNTGALNITNISSVNITIPDSFSFLAGSNGTDGGTHTFSNTSNILNWDNDNLVMNLTRNYFWFNATAPPPGTYNLTVNTTNSTTSSITNISVTINDTTAPGVIINLPTNTTYSGNNITFNVTVTDNFEMGGCWFTTNNGVRNYTMTNTSATSFNYTNSSIVDGGYTVIYYCNDSTNNINNSLNVSFRLYNAPAAEEEPLGDSGVYVPVFWTSTEVIDGKQFEQGITRELSVKSRLKVKINNIDHYVGIRELTSSTATIETASAPSEATLSVGEERNFEVTGDEYYDIYVKLDSISEDKAKITIKSIYVLVTEDTISEDEKAEGEAEKQKAEDVAGEKPTDLTWLWIIIVVVLIIMGIWYLKYKK